MMNYNDFRLGGRYKHKYEVSDKHYIILIEAFSNKNEPINNHSFIEIDILDDELISIINNLNENELIAIIGHIESEVCTVNDNFKYMNKLLVADKIIIKGN